MIIHLELDEEDLAKSINESLKRFKKEHIENLIERTVLNYLERHGLFSIIKEATKEEVRRIYNEEKSNLLKKNNIISSLESNNTDEKRESLLISS